MYTFFSLEFLRGSNFLAWNSSGVAIFQPGIPQGQLFSSLEFLRGSYFLAWNSSGVAIFSLEFLKGSYFTAWNSSGVDIFQPLSSIGGVRILNGIAQQRAFSCFHPIDRLTRRIVELEMFRWNSSVNLFFKSNDVSSSLAFIFSSMNFNCSSFRSGLLPLRLASAMQAVR